MRMHHLALIVLFGACVSAGCAMRQAGDADQVSRTVEILPFGMAVNMMTGNFAGDPIIEFNEVHVKKVLVDSTDPRFSRETLIPFLQEILSKHKLSLVKKAGQKNRYVVTKDQ